MWGSSWAVIILLGAARAVLGQLSISNDPELRLRICIPEPMKPLCDQMVTELTMEGGRIECVTANDKIGCIERVIKNEADFLVLEPEEIYLAQRFKSSAFSIIGEIRTEEFKDRDYRYEPVAVIRNSAGIRSISDLRGKKSCHTGFGRNAGWKIPFSHLMNKNEFEELCNEINAPTPERDLFTVSKYFSKACAPGPWVPEKEADAQLRAKYPNLCELCENKHECSGKDKYSGYEGALKCLTENGADVAWTKMDAVEKFFGLKSGSPTATNADYSFLCWDGSSLPLTSPNINACSWAKRPWRAILASSRLNSSDLVDLQSQIDLYKGHAALEDNILHPTWSIKVLEINATGEVVFRYPAHLAKSTTPGLYLAQKNYSVTIEKPSCTPAHSIRICVQNEIEMLKCLDLRLGAISRRIVPGFDCVLGENQKNCVKRVAQGDADVMIVGPKPASRAERDTGLISILSELETTNEDQTDTFPFRYAVAVVRADSNFQNLTDLKGRKSCHGSIKSLAGWNVPMNVLRDKGLLMGPNCGLSIEISKFFNASCVPGVLEARRTMSWLPETLCELCAGDSSPGSTDPRSPNTFCQDNELERYYGDSGALQCLADHVGDVAFLDHVGLVHRPAGILNSKDVKLLCSNGALRMISQYKTCNWGKVPSHKVIARGGEANFVAREDARLSLLKLSDQFSPFGKSKGVLNLFGSYYGNKNLLVQDTSVGLTDELRDPSLTKLIEEFDYCTTSAAPSIIGSSLSQLLSFILIFALSRL